MMRRLVARPVVLHTGDEEIAPGLSLHDGGGHTMGMQIVRVNTRRGVIVLLRMRLTCTRAWNVAFRTRSPTTSVKSWKAIAAPMIWRVRASTTFLDTIRSY